MSAKPAKRTRTSGKSARRILVLNGPNLNILGRREPGIYGITTLAAINSRLAKAAEAAGARLDSFQSNSEGALIERIHRAAIEKVDFIIINPAGYTHTSVALRDALTGVGIPFVEVHLSNVNAREEFRKRSLFSDVAVGTICGLGARGYDLALSYALDRLA
jgi:3-dehydroquinate dehydratase-2